MRIGVIGATGMLGHHAARAAQARGHELVVFHRASSKLERIADLEFRSVVADLDDRERLSAGLAQVDAVIVCAGYYPTVPRPWREEVATAVGQMENLYAACADARLHKIVYVGGAIALRRNPRGEPADETLEYAERPRDHNAYLQVKWAMDRQARERAQQGLPVVVGIPSMTFGEDDWGPTTGELIVRIANRELPAYVRGRRNAIHAGDAGRGLVRCCEDGRPAERYLLCGENVTMSDLVRRIARLADVPVPPAVPVLLARVVSAAQTVVYRLGGPAPRISSTAIAVMSGGQYLDGGKARRELGFEAEVSLDDALWRTLAWFRDVGYVR